MSSEASTFAVRLRTALFEVVAQEPAEAPRYVSRVVAVLFGLLLIWCMFAKLDIVAVAGGRLVPETYVKIVQPAEAGIVREILVEEGDTVQAGQVLLRLDPTENSLDSAAAQTELAMQRFQVRRIDAELASRPMQRLRTDDTALFAQVDRQHKANRRRFLDDVAQEQSALKRSSRELVAARELLEKVERTLPSYQRSARAYEELAANKLVGRLQADERTREALEKSQDVEAQRATVESLEAAVAQSERRIDRLQSTYESDLHAARVEAMGKVTQLEQMTAKLQLRREYLELRAPQDGTVKELATTTIGTVVEPGTVLLSLVPAREPLVAEVDVGNEDIGFVRAGQQVRLKLATYPFQKYGMIEGTVRTVSADSRSSAQTALAESERDSGQGAPLTFKAIVELSSQQLSSPDVSLSLAAGMQLSAEIVEGRRTVLEYLLSPVRKVADEAGRER